MATLSIHPRGARTALGGIDSVCADHPIDRGVTRPEYPSAGGRTIRLHQLKEWDSRGGDWSCIPICKVLGIGAQLRPGKSPEHQRMRRMRARQPPYQPFHMLEGGGAAPYIIRKEIPPIFPVSPVGDRYASGNYFTGWKPAAQSQEGYFRRNARFSRIKGNPRVAQKRANEAMALVATNRWAMEAKSSKNQMGGIPKSCVNSPAIIRENRL